MPVPTAEDDIHGEEPRDWRTGRIFPRGGILWIEYYDASGRQRRESTANEIKAERLRGKSNIDERKVAEQLLRKRIGAKDNDILPPLTKSRVTVEELYDDERAYLLNAGKSKTAA